MKIYHFVNSFVCVEEEKTLLTCDPWIGTTSCSGWFSYPIKKSKEIDPKIFNSNFIYISHLHCDHLDFKSLLKFKNKNLTFLIKKFKNGVLKRRLQKFSKRIIEIEPWKKTKINKDLSIAIIPQVISNSSDLTDNIQYDIDTSIVVQSNKDKSIFFNNVDTPMNIKVLRKINKFIHDKFKKNVDVFCYALGAASEFPQCFLNVNRSNEKKRIVKQSLDEINSYLKLLKPRIFFPAGGTYAIYGKFYNLNKYIAQPTFEEIQKSTSKLKCKVLNLIGGGYVDLDQGNYIYYNKSKILKKTFNNNFIKEIKDINYYYEDKKKINYQLNKIDQNFIDAKNNYFKFINKNKKIDSSWKINFNVYRELVIGSNCRINKKKSSFFKTYNIKNYNKNKNKIDKLDCYIEYKLFNYLIKGKYPWNTSLTGSTIMYKRNHVKCNVDMMNSIEFLRA